MIIAVDFDGTCVANEFPNVGRDIGAAPVLRALVDNGHKIILLTMRSHNEPHKRPVLEEAIKWFEDNNIKLFAININPLQKDWSNSNKVFANIYIDDNNLGVPLIKELEDENPHVDWELVSYILATKGLITYSQLDDIKEQWKQK